MDRGNGQENISHSFFPAKARGTAITFRKRTRFINTDTISDKEGQFLIVTGEIQYILCYL